MLSFRPSTKVTFQSYAFCEHMKLLFKEESVLIKVTTLLIWIFVANHSFALDKIISPSGDHCKDQAYDWLYEHAGDVTVELVQRDHFGHKGTKSYNYWFTVKECKGYIVASTRAMNPSCKGVHYGSVPKFIVRIWASNRSCRALLKDSLDEYEDFQDEMDVVSY